MSLHASTLPTFSPPGNLPELTSENRAIWSEKFISQWMNDEIAGNVDGPYEKRDSLFQFFNGTITPFETTQNPKAIQWIAFPNLVKIKFGEDNDLRWKIADSSRMFQDEYLEWSVARDDQGRITSVIYTCEGPEYWQFYAAVQQDDAIATIEKINDLDPKQTDENAFFLTPYVDPDNRSKWIYNPTNYYNFRTDTGTIIHLIHPSNTLGAEIDIAAQATVIRKDKQGKTVTDPDQLIKCSKYGNPGRNSDPSIGAAINSIARTGASISVADPVALYIYKFDTGNFRLDVTGGGDPDQADLKPVPASWYEFQRGDISKHRGLRLRVRNNTNQKTSDGSRLLTVSDIYDKKTNNYIQYGAQFTDYITMSVSGVTTMGIAAEAKSCPAPPPKKTTAESVADGAMEAVHRMALTSHEPHTPAKWKPGKRY